MIEPILSLAFGMYSIKGAYALLLGSGVSRSAGILTGWGIVLDLIRKLAKISGQDCEPDPAAWYKATFGAEPGYSSLLDQIAASPSERNRLLRSYFEPSAEEREQGLKLPTAAHKAIAELVAAGFVRVIVTTNFDRLIEQALEAVGIQPTVISTPDAVEGALPLVHTPCTVIKVHGDYLDTRTKNSPAELAEYDPRTNRLLDRIFDEFGLIVCGWSAEWDTALRGALERCPNHRFTTYWTARGDPQDHAKNLIALRRAQVIKIQDADTFFKALAEKVTALADLDKPHPLSAKVAVASLKKYLPEDRYRIELHDLVRQEADNLYAKLIDREFPVNESWADNQDLQLRLRRRVERYEAYTETLQALFATGCFWGESQHEPLWTRVIEHIANPGGSRSGTIVWLNLQRYPALLLLYAGGIASIAAQKYGTLAALLTKAKVLGTNQSKPLVLEVNTLSVMVNPTGHMLPDMDDKPTPLSSYMFARLREPLHEIIPGDHEYEECFDRFEYLLGLAYADMKYAASGSGVRPVGCFSWRYVDHLPQDSLSSRVEAEVQEAGDSWLPLQAGFFGKSLDRFLTIKKDFDEFVARQPW